MSDSYTELFSITARLITPPGERPKFADSDIRQFIKIGVSRVQQLLRARNITDVTSSVDLTVLAGGATVDAAQIGAYGFINKTLRLWERPVSDTMGWVPMRKVHPLPLNQSVGDRFGLWDLERFDALTVLVRFPAACSGDMMVRFEGTCRIFQDNSTTNQLYYLNNTLEPVSFFAASLAAQSSGKEKFAATLERQGMEFIDGLVAEDVHLKQLQPARMYAVRNGLRDRWW